MTGQGDCDGGVGQGDVGVVVRSFRGTADEVDQSESGGEITGLELRLDGVIDLVPTTQRGINDLGGGELLLRITHASILHGNQRFEHPPMAFRILADMKLLLTSFGHASIASFLTGTIAYIPDAARSFRDSPDVNVEREMLRSQGLTVRELPLATTAPAEVDRILGEADGVYVAGGETFDLMWVLRSTGTDAILARHVRAGLPFIGCSAGSVIAGPSIEPVSLLDDPAVAPSLHDYSGLGFTDRVIIPHAGGNIPQFPIDIFAEIVRRYGKEYPLVLLRDGEALLIEDSQIRLI